MFKEYLNDGTVFTMTVDGDFSKLFEVLGIEVPKKEDNFEELNNACETVTDAIKSINRIITETVSAQTSEAEAPENKDPETAELKAACDVVERHNKCFNSQIEFCRSRACKDCEYHDDVEVVRKAVNQLLDHTKKSLNCGDEVNNRYARNVTGGVELALLHTDETPALCTGVVFKKGGIYSVTLSGNFMFVDYIGPNDTTCVGCRNNLSDICSSCSRRYMDHYKKEDNNE